MATIPATWTTAAVLLFTDRLRGVSGALGVIDSFKVGEGGWELTAAGKVPRAPDPTLTDLDCIVNPARYPVDSVGNFQKVLGPLDLIAYPSGLVAVTLLDFGEFNADGFGNFPEIYEIGLFVGATMVAYGTFPVEIKTPAVQLPNDVTLVMELV